MERRMILQAFEAEEQRRVNQARREVALVVAGVALGILVGLVGVVVFRLAPGAEEMVRGWW